MSTTTTLQMEADQLKLASTVCSSLSIIGATCVVLHFLLTKQPQTVVARLLFFMGLSDILTSCFKVIGVSYLEALGAEGWVCQLQGFMIQFGNLAHIFWSGMLSVNLFLLFYLRWPISDLKAIYRYDWVVCFGIPLLTALAPLLAIGVTPKIYGNADLWCWISKDYAPLQIGLHFVPLWLVFLYTLFNYLAIAKKIWNYRYSEFDRITAHSKYSYSRAATICLVMFLITWIPSTINRIHTIIYNQKNFTYTLLQGIFSGLRGFNYALVYFYFLLIKVVRAKQAQDNRSDNGNHLKPVEFNVSTSRSKDGEVVTIESMESSIYLNKYAAANRAPVRD